MSEAPVSQFKQDKVAALDGRKRDHRAQNHDTIARPGANGAPRERPPTIETTTALTNATGKRPRADEEHIDVNKRRRPNSPERENHRISQRDDSRARNPPHGHRYDDRRRDARVGYEDNRVWFNAQERPHYQEQRPSPLGQPSDSYDAHRQRGDQRRAPGSRRDGRRESSRFPRDQAYLQRTATAGDTFMGRANALGTNDTGSRTSDSSHGPSGHQTDPRKRNGPEKWVPGQIYWASHIAIAFDPNADPTRDSSFLQGKYALFSQKLRPFMCKSMTKDVGVEGFPICTGTQRGIAGQPDWKRKYLFPLGLRSQNDPSLQGSQHRPVEIRMFDGEQISANAFVDISQSYPTAYFEESRIVGVVEKEDALRLIDEHHKAARQAEEEAWDRHDMGRRETD